MLLQKKPELLAPCGSQAALEAAIAGGADAVYAGGAKFNARMSAKNFDENAIASAVSLCHKNGVRFYTTLNTSIYDKELGDALSFAAYLYEVGVDALIITDLGLISLIRKHIPDLELHASTQLSGHNVRAAEFLASLGISRMVCARELSGENIKALCKSSPIEIEMFIHGAHCVSASGQCLMSAMIGGRSGNRGECAQPCRLPYNGSYPLSLRDMCLAPHIEEILESGVASLKIEGRLKSPSYVYGVTSVYRRLIDEGRNATEGEMKKLAALFSRGGFTDGYFTKKIGASMLGVRSDADKDASRRADTAIKRISRGLEPIVKEKQKAPDVPKKPSFEPVFDREKQTSARFVSSEQIAPDKFGGFFDIIYLPLDKFKENCRANGVVLPPVVFDSEYADFENKLKNAYKNGARHALCGNVGQLRTAREIGFEVHGDFRLNIFNSATAAFLLEHNLSDMLLSPELILPQIRDIRTRKSVIVYGKIPLMLLEKRSGAKTLRDRRGVVFPVIPEGARESVVNSVPIWTADREQEFKKAGIFRRHFIFTTESVREIEGVITAYKKGSPPHGDIRRIK